VPSEASEKWSSDSSGSEGELVVDCEGENQSGIPVILGTPGSSCAPGSFKLPIGSDGGWRLMMCVWYAVWSVEKGW
jgi:hypothetical protein